MFSSTLTSFSSSAQTSSPAHYAPFSEFLARYTSYTTTLSLFFCAHLSQFSALFDDVFASYFRVQLLSCLGKTVAIEDSCRYSTSAHGRRFVVLFRVWFFEVQASDFDASAHTRAGIVDKLNRSVWVNPRDNPDMCKRIIVGRSIIVGIPALVEEYDISEFWLTSRAF